MDIQARGGEAQEEGEPADELCHLAALIELSLTRLWYLITLLLDMFPYKGIFDFSDLQDWENARILAVRVSMCLAGIKLREQKLAGRAEKHLAISSTGSQMQNAD